MNPAYNRGDMLQLLKAVGVIRVEHKLYLLRTKFDEGVRSEEQPWLKGSVKMRGEKCFRSSKTDEI